MTGSTDTPRRFGPDEIPDLLAVIERAGGILVGGQALAVWAQVYEDRLPGSAIPTSKDVDVLGNRDTVRTLAELLNGDERYVSRNAVEVGIIRYRDSDGVERTLDVLQTVAGVRRPKKRAVPIEVTLSDDSQVSIVVMHPVDVLRSRIANVYSLHRTDDHSVEQARIAVPCAREFLRELAPTKPVHVQKCAQELFRLAKSGQGKKLYREYGIEVFDAIDAFEGLGDKFHRENLPRMKAAVARLRGT